MVAFKAALLVVLARIVTIGRLSISLRQMLVIFLLEFTPLQLPMFLTVRHRVQLKFSNQIHSTLLLSQPIFFATDSQPVPLMPLLLAERHPTPISVLHYCPMKILIISQLELTSILWLITMGVQNNIRSFLLSLLPFLLLLK